MSTNILLPPAVLDIDNCKVYVWNIITTTNIFGKKRYLVSLQVECYGKLSKQACFDVASEDELISVLRKEIAMFKSIVLSGAYNVYTWG
jgi:hypothetical protein